MNEMTAGAWDSDELDTLAFETALEYYAPEDLALVFSRPEADVRAMQELPDFQRLVQRYRKEIDDDGTRFRLRARKYAEISLDVVNAIVHSEWTDPKERLKAARELRDAAGWGDAPKEDAGVRLVIQTNLSLGDAEPRGSYTIEAPERQTS